MDGTEPKKIRIFTAMQLGCFTGLLSACAPAFLFGLALNRLVHTIRSWVLRWDGPNAELSIGGLLGGTSLSLSLDMQDHLQMTDALTTMHSIEKGWWWTIPAITLGLTLLVAIGLAVLSGVSAGLYNEIGRHRWLAPSAGHSNTLRPPTQISNRSNEEYRNAD